MLQLRLLGPPQISLAGTSVIEALSSKAQAILFYLAVTGQPQARAALATLLWGDTPEEAARTNLRKALVNLREVVGDRLVTDRRSVAFRADSATWVDAIEFKARISALTEIKRLQTAVDLYRGDFLTGFYVLRAPDFETWMLAEQANLRELVIQALHTLAGHHAEQGELAEGIAYTRQLLSLEPWREEAHHQLMLLLARSGQRSVALAQFEVCRRMLAEELGVEPGRETITLYRRIRDGEFDRKVGEQGSKGAGEQGNKGEVFAPALPLPGPPDSQPAHNLPPQPNSFIGREKELAEIRRLLIDEPACRLLTLVGPGGIGKTRLALAAAAEVVADFPQGVHFVSLASVSEAEFVVPAVAEALKFNFSGGKEPKIQLLNYLHSRKLLLVFDSYEHLITSPAGEDMELLSEILGAAPQVMLLVTSRERLNLQEEWSYEVQGLEVPPLQAEPEVREFETYSAVQLFLQRARRANATFSFSVEDRRHVGRICHLVAGMPLGLELAAVWTRLMTCQEIAQEIERNLDFLTTSVRNMPERHRSLRAVFEQTWQRLPEVEQRVLSKVSVFKGGCLPEAAKKVAGASWSMIAPLMDKSLLRRSPAGRYELHELVRQYAAEKLWGEVSVDEPSDLARQVWQAHSRYYLHFAGRQERLLRSMSPQEAIAAMRVELDNIRQAWHWAVTHNNLEDIAAALDGLSRFYDLTGLFAEGETTFAQTAAQIQAGLTPTEVSPAQQEICCRLLVEQARLLHRRGLTQEGVQAAKQATELAQLLGSIRLEALARHQWGDNLSLGGQLEAAHGQLERALQLAQTARLPIVEAEAWRDLGIVHIRQNNYVEAKTIHEQALSLFEALGDRRGATIILMNLATLNSWMGDYTGVQLAYEQALQNFREMEDCWGETLVTINLGDHLYEEGNYTAALALSQRGLQLCRQFQDRANESLVAENLGHILSDLGDYPGAQRYYEQALTISRAIGDRRGEARALSHLGLVCHHLGQYETAYDYCQQARQLIQAVGVQASQALVLTHLGHVLVALNQPVKAAEVYHQALALYQAMGELQHALASQAGLANLALTQGELNQALAHTEEILSYLQTKGVVGVQGLFQVYLICYHALQANQDPRAEEALATAHRLLQERAANIDDEQLRRSFLENVPAHRKIGEEWANRRR